MASSFLDPEIMAQFFELVNELHDDDDLAGLKALRFRKGHPDIIEAPNVGVIVWGYLKAAIDTLSNGTKRRIQAAEAEFWGETEIDAIWPLAPRPYCHADYWTRTIVPLTKKEKAAKKRAKPSTTRVVRNNKENAHIKTGAM